MAKVAPHPRRARKAPTMLSSIDNSEDESGSAQPDDEGDYGDDNVGEFSPGSSEPEPEDNDEDDIKRGKEHG